MIAGAPARQAFIRGLNLFDATMVVVGVMIGSGIFIVSAEMARLINSPGWLLAAWIVTGVLTVTAALSYGELASMMPQAGGMYVYLREAWSPLWGFLYGWTFFTVIQTGTIAAVSVAFARFTAVLWPGVGENHYLVSPIPIGSRYAVSLSTAQALAICVVVLLTWTNSRGLKYGKVVQNLFTSAKLAAVAALIIAGLTIARSGEAVSVNFTDMWRIGDFDASLGVVAGSLLGLITAISVSQSGSLFSADSWHDVSLIAGEVRNPGRNVPLAMALGSGIVIVLYLLVNVAYLVSLPLPAIQHAAADRVATAMLERVLPGTGTSLMAAAIMISTFGCINSLVLAGARAYYAMARDGLFFRAAGELNGAHVPGWSLFVQGLWSAVLILPRTHDPITGAYGNLYSNLLDYVISAALLFYVLTIAGVMRLRARRPGAERPFRVPAYPLVPVIYIAAASVVLGILAASRPSTTWPGLGIVLLGIPVYLAIRPAPVVTNSRHEL
jgi:APA family basic amino acid/polyamine antiporter